MSGQWTVSDLYPNPGREWCRFSIHAPYTTVADAHITIADVSGREVLNISERLSKQDNTILLRLPPLAAGTYIVNIEVAGKLSEARKLVIE